MRIFIVLLITWLCAGCVVAPVTSDVTVFHRLGASLEGSSFSFIALDGQQSLEHESYCQVVRSHLSAAGMHEAPSADQALYLIAIDYFIGAPIQRTGPMPVFGQTGVSGSSTTGTIQTYGNTSTVQTNTTYTPTYGVTGYVPISSMSYRRGFTLLMYDTKRVQAGDFKPSYEGKVASVGSTGALPRVLPTLIEALFQEFPGESGETRTEELRCEACNR